MMLMQYKTDLLVVDLFNRNVMHYMAIKDSCTCAMNLFSYLEGLGPKFKKEIATF